MDEAWLRKQYGEGRSLQSIADEIGCSRGTVRNRCIALGIERRSPGEHFKGVPKSAEQRRKMADARRKYWEQHPDRDSFRTKISETKRKALKNRDRPTAFDLKLGNIHESRLVMMKIVGRNLSSVEHVHHINGDFRDNRPENLMLLSASEHGKLHYAERPRNSKGQFLPVVK